MAWFLKAQYSSLGRYFFSQKLTLVNLLKNSILTGYSLSKEIMQIIWRSCSLWQCFSLKNSYFEDYLK